MRIAAPLLVSAVAVAQCGGQNGSISYACDSLGLTSLKFQGVEYFDTAGWARSIPITFGPIFSDGTQPGNGSRIATAGANYSAITLASNTSYSYQVRFDYSTPDSNTLKITVSLKNPNSTAAINSFLTIDPVSLALPKPYTVVSAASGDALSGSFGAYFVTPSASVVYFSTNFSDTWYAVTASMGTNLPDSAHDRWNLGLSNTEHNGPVNPSTPIPPLSTKSIDVYIRFGPVDADPATMEAEALAALRSEIPQQVTWPDRRPISTWFLADYGHASAANPRGWFNNSSCNCTNQAAFHAALQGSLNQLLGVVNAQPIRPQAVVLWDMEGEQFPQVMTYVGNPPLLPSLAPEMDAEIDSVMATLRANGYRVGMTLRPQHFYSGSSLPGTCNYNTNKDYTDFFLLAAGTTPSPSYNACLAGGVWTTSAGSINNQISYTDEASVLAELANKVRYANTRWGATVFYVDSTVWSGGSPMLFPLWQQLQAQFPNCLFIPEQKTDMTYAFTAPYSDAHQGNFWSSASHRFLYPSAFAAINLGNTNQTEAAAGFANVSGPNVTLVSGASFTTGSSWSGQTIYLNGVAYTIRSVQSSSQLTLTSAAPKLNGQTWRVGNLAGLIEAGMASGDIYLYPGWFTSWQQGATAALLQEANYICVVTDTSSGKLKSLGASPGGSYTIALKMKITFADSGDDLAASTVTCAGGSPCSVDLSRLGVYQISYYDLTGKLIAQKAPECVSTCPGTTVRRPRRL